VNQKQKLFLTSITTITIAIAITITYAITTSSTTSQTSDKLQIVTTFYPLTYITQQIGGEHVEITQLIPNNTEIHNWEPSAAHIKSAENANIIFYNGAGADHWMEDEILPALSTAKNRTIVETTDNLTLITNQERDKNDKHDNGHDHNVYDPHTWISPYMAKQQAEIIYNTLITIDPQHENYYTQRWQNLKQQFEHLDKAYLTNLANTSKNAIFVSHGAFGYLAERYGFVQYSVIGISADEQPSARTIINLIEEIKKHKIHVLYVDPAYSHNYINTLQTEVHAQTGQSVEILNIYLMLGPQNGLNYLEQMQTNLSNLQTGLAVQGVVK